MKPGATTCPGASITRGASPRSPGSTAGTRSRSTATSARRAGPPVPSTTEPFRMSSDQVTDSPRLRLRLALPRHTLGGGGCPPSPNSPPQTGGYLHTPPPRPTPPPPTPRPPLLPPPPPPPRHPPPPPRQCG